MQVNPYFDGRHGHERSMGTEPKAILCLCHDATILQVRRLLLERFGYTVLPVDSADAATTVAGNRCPDMFIMDHSFPGEHYEEVTGRVKKVCPEVITLVLSPFFTIGNSRTSSVDRFVSREDAPDSLIASVRELLSEREARDKSGISE
jgi:CheY-like chemotaxis protein